MFLENLYIHFNEDPITKKKKKNTSFPLMNLPLISLGLVHLQ